MSKAKEEDGMGFKRFYQTLSSCYFDLLVLEQNFKDKLQFIPIYDCPYVSLFFVFIYEI